MFLTATNKWLTDHLVQKMRDINNWWPQEAIPPFKFHLQAQGLKCPQCVRSGIGALRKRHCFNRVRIWFQSWEAQLHQQLAYSSKTSQWSLSGPRLSIPRQLLQADHRLVSKLLLAFSLTSSIQMQLLLTFRSPQSQAKCVSTSALRDSLDRRADQNLRV